MVPLHTIPSSVTACALHTSYYRCNRQLGDCIIPLNPSTQTLFINIALLVDFEGSRNRPSGNHLSHADPWSWLLSVMGGLSECNRISVALCLSFLYHIDMSRFEKLLQRLQSRPGDFTYDELRTVLQGLGYMEMQRGRTSGSRVAFHNGETQHIIRLHRPHPSNQLKRYQIDELLEELRRIGVIR